MLIDWFTVIAQIVNFLVLVFLLKHFLYGRIINAMNQREENIASRLEEAEKRKKEAEQEAEIYRKKNQEWDEKREEMLSRAEEEAGARRKGLIEKAREEVDQMKARWHEAIQREKNSFLQDLRQRAGRQIYAIARRALKDLANADLEERIIDVFIDRIRDLDENSRKGIVRSIKKADKNVIINSAFELPQSIQQRITEAIRAPLGDGIEVKFQTSPDMILGLELKAHGYKIAWSLDNYFESLESEIREALEEETKDSSKET
jgi:F-type H+-transporting ATPase subunit b